MHFVEHQRAVRFEDDGAQTLAVLGKEIDAEGHNFVVIGDEVAVAVHLFDLFVQSVHNVAYALVEQLILVLEVGVERPAVDEGALADVDDSNRPERFLVEELVERIDDSLCVR